MHIGSIVIHCYKFDTMVAFWRDALGYVPREKGTSDWIVLCDPTGEGPNLSFQARDRPAKARSWLHLDLYTGQRDREIERLLDLGAKRYPWKHEPHDDFIVLEDPDGNLFCVVQRGEGPNQAMQRTPNRP